MEQSKSLLLEFLKDVKAGLSSKQKYIPSKYLYDERGSSLFNQITRHPDYYLTNCEIESLHQFKTFIATLFDNEPFNLVELGPGEGVKTEILTHEFVSNHLDFDYFPIDISKSYLDILQHKLEHELKTHIKPIHADFFDGLKALTANSKRRKLVLFLGSNIGNFNLKLSKEFFKHLNQTMSPGDYLLIGFDLDKQEDILMRAYDDRDGITRAFNMNLLTRMNHELGADFDLHHFRHLPVYNQEKHAMQSFLVSSKEQVVNIEEAKQTVSFKAGESIYVEKSQKYLFHDMEALASEAGFQLVKTNTDSRQYFADGLWQLT